MIYKVLYYTFENNKLKGAEKYFKSKKDAEQFKTKIQDQYFEYINIQFEDLLKKLEEYYKEHTLGSYDESVSFYFHKPKIIEIDLESFDE